MQRERPLMYLCALPLVYDVTLIGSHSKFVPFVKARGRLVWKTLPYESDFSASSGPFIQMLSA